MHIIGLGCTAQVGKDTAADYLENNYDKVKKVSFADKVKHVCMNLFGLSHEQCYGPVSIKEAVDLRYGLTPREIMQGVGDKMRQIYAPIWIDTLFTTVVPELVEEGYDCFVIADVRYPNEADKIHKMGGTVVKVVREAGGVSVGADHPSETSMQGYEDFDFIITNNGTLEEFYEKLDKLMEVVIHGRAERQDNDRGEGIRS